MFFFLRNVQTTYPRAPRAIEAIIEFVAYLAPLLVMRNQHKKYADDLNRSVPVPQCSTNTLAMLIGYQYMLLCCITIYFFRYLRLVPCMRKLIHPHFSKILKNAKYVVYVASYLLLIVALFEIDSCTFFQETSDICFYIMSGFLFLFCAWRAFRYYQSNDPNQPIPSYQSI